MVYEVWTGAFKPLLGDAVSRKQQRGLFGIADTANAARCRGPHLVAAHGATRTLVVDEIELAAADMDVELPPLRAVMDREVTEEPEYANAHLAR